MNRVATTLVAAAVFAVVIATGAMPASADEAEADFFEERVRPILAARCSKCHGDEEPEMGLSLTSRAGVLKGGESGPAALEGRPDESLLVQAVRQTGELKMPPDTRLRDDEIEALSQWVELGLPWPQEAGPEAGGIRPPGLGVTEADRRHWAFQPIADPAAPEVRDVGWPKTDIDKFILARLEAGGLAPAPPADRRTLIRRAFYDLVGLPPSWHEVQAFVDDPAADAFERVVDRLLASPQYGERWGRHWLDVARYADTKDGVLMYGDDRIRPFAYTYRDYVVRAFNDDIPFDRFVQEQLAADQIQPPVEPWRLAAMGLLTLGRMFDNNIHDIIDDQIDVVSRGFLGLTVSCARCHDHKYDPIPTADYYSLYGVFASSEAPLELPLIEEPQKVPGGWEFEQEAAAKRAELLKMRDEQYALLSETARERAGDYLVRVATTQPDPLETAIFFMSLAPEDLRPPITARWRQYVAARATADDPVFGPWRELVDKANADTEGAFAAEAAAVLENWKTRPEGTCSGQLNPLVRAALAEALAAGTLHGPADVARVYGDLLERVYEESKAAAAGTASGASGNSPHSGKSDGGQQSGHAQQLLDILVSRDSPGWFPKNQTRRYMSRMDTDAFGGKMQELDRMAVTSRHAPPRAMVVTDSQVLTDPCIFVRGNASQRGTPVPRQFLEILATGQRTPFPNGSGRLDLAKAIASPDNPLTSRVLVNRVWMHHFGEPLISTPSDFGFRCRPPMHPELLDHLATRFMGDGWSLKQLHRRIMLSSVYQQSAAPAAEMAEAARAADPDNRLLWRMPRRRLDFEAMRDTLLALSGRLEHRAGGRPADVAGEPQCRERTLYGLVDRQSLPGVFRAFDFAAPDQSVERRARTMVPQQALFALNSPFVVEQAKALAARPELQEQGDDPGRVAALYRVVYAREPSAEEVEACLAFVGQPADAGSQLTGWEQLAQALLSSNELMYLD